MHVERRQDLETRKGVRSNRDDLVLVLVLLLKCLEKIGNINCKLTTWTVHRVSGKMPKT